MNKYYLIHYFYISITFIDSYCKSIYLEYAKIIKRTNIASYLNDSIIF